jgi:hypothetical protein
MSGPELAVDRAVVPRGSPSAPIDISDVAVASTERGVVFVQRPDDEQTPSPVNRKVSR